MGPSCANPGCTASGTKTCVRCRRSSYCSKRCQKENWAQHKPSCTPADSKGGGGGEGKNELLVQCVKIYGGGGRYEEMQLPRSNGVFATAPLPVSVRIGYPLVMKRVVPHALPRGPDTDNRHAAWLMIDPETGFAPPEWQGGVGSVYVARPDGQPLTSDTLAGITDYVSDILNAFGDDRSVRGSYDRAKLDRYLARHRKMQMDYQAALRDPEYLAEVHELDKV